MSKITKYKDLGKSQNKNPHNQLVYNMRKRMKENETVYMKTFSPHNPIIPVKVVLFAQGSTFVVKTPTTEDNPEGYYTFANDNKKFWTPYNYNRIQAWLEMNQSLPLQYNDMVVRLVNSETDEVLNVRADTVRVRQPGENLGSHHPVVFGLPDGRTITSKVWHDDAQKVADWKKKESTFKGDLNHVRLVFKYGGKEYDNCFIYFKLGSAQFNQQRQKGVHWNRIYSTFGL